MVERDAEVAARAARLFLGSEQIAALPEFLGTPRGKSVAFVPTASNPLDDRAFVEEFRDRLRSMGLVVHDVDLDDTTPSRLAAAIDARDLVFVAGGDPFYLLDRARRSGFDGIVSRAVRAGKPYVGISAGAIVAGPTLEPVVLTSPFAPSPGLSLEGVHLTDVLVLPHENRPGRSAEHGAALSAFGGRVNIIRLADDQAVVVVGGRSSVIAT